MPNPSPATVVANGESVRTQLPRTIEQFLMDCNLPPKSVVVEQNGEAVSPSEFGGRSLADGDRLEIVRIVAGG